MLIIGIAGGTGSGKTTVVKKIIRNLSNECVGVVSQDAYYKDNSGIPQEQRQKINFDHPDSLEFDLMIQHLKELKAGNSIEEPVYSYLTCTRSEETKTVHPKKVMIVEGILVLTHPKLRDLFDLKVFVHAEADDRLSRVIKRDIEERGRSAEAVLERYEKTVKPMHLQFIEPSKRYADIIIPQGGNNEKAIGLLTEYINKY